jgi:uncharacterized membrane protein YeiH
VTNESTQLVTLDLIGAFVFALSGALAAVRARLDIFGVVVIGTVTAIGGGILRDVLLGAAPPNSLRHWPYLAVPAAAAVVVFYWHPHVARLRRPVVVLDAAGLGLFTVTGTRLALDAGLGSAGACALGLITGIGGGVIRDVLLRQIPLVLQRGELYAIVSLVGAVLVCIGQGSHLISAGWLSGSATVVFLLRLLAVSRHWRAPQPRFTEDQAGA